MLPLPSEALLISFVTGTRIAALRAALGERPVVRLMPNTPAQIGEGVSVWTATADCSSDQREHARALIGALGEEVYVDDEAYLDMATALSGSGPGYVFLFIEALIDAGVRIGLARPIAEKLVLQTVKGSALYVQRSGQHPAALRNAVTSPGGTTAEGLHQLESGGLRAAVDGLTVDFEGMAETITYGGDGKDVAVSGVIVGTPDAEAPLGITTEGDFYHGTTFEGTDFYNKLDF